MLAKLVEAHSDVKFLSEAKKETDNSKYHYIKKLEMVGCLLVICMRVSSLEKGNCDESQDMYRLAAQNHILFGYEKLAELSEQKGDSIRLEIIYEAWAQTGDPAGLVKLGELLIKKGDNKKATACFKRAGLRGMEKMIEHAPTWQKRKKNKKKLKKFLKKKGINL